MKALLTAGGHATRLRPITNTINKHLIPLANKPMLVHALEKLRDAGIREVGININTGEEEIVKAIGDGKRWDMAITYLEQTGGPMGLSHIIRNAQSWIGNESFLFYLGDNIILGSVATFIERFVKDDLDCLLALAKVSDPERFGVPELDGDRIVRVIEKPVNPPSDYAVTGIYCYKPCIFEAVASLQPSARGEYEISDAHTWLIDHGYRVGWEEITGWWKDTGKAEDLLHGNELLLGKLTHKNFASGVVVDEHVIIDGPVEIGEGTTISKGCVIRGPVSIGAQCKIIDATIGPFVSIADHVTIERTQIERSLIMEGTIIRCADRIVDSVFGRKVIANPRVLNQTGGKRFFIGDSAEIEF